jgi:hypothetical protein
MLPRWRLATRAQRKLKRAARAGSELTASIAHEVSQPLGAMALNATAGLRFLRFGT